MKKNKIISVSWLFEKDEADAPVKIRIGFIRRGYRGGFKSWKRAFAFVWGAVLLFVLVNLIRMLF